jgi:hypothetical protein
MRRTLLLSGISVVGGVLLAGCGGGGSDSAPAPTFTEVTKSVYGFVYVASGLAPSGSPNVVITNSSTAPDGYLPANLGTLTIQVADGEITRAADSEVFNLSAGNFIAAKVTSRTSVGGTPSFTFSGSGLGSTTGPVGTGTFPIAATNVSLNSSNSLQALTFNSAAYTAGPAASLRVLLRDRSVSGSKFGAPATVLSNIIPGNEDNESYDVLVITQDANGVVLGNASDWSVTDSFSGSDYSFIDFNAGSAPTRGGKGYSIPDVIYATGGGDEGDDVQLTFTTPVASGLSTSFTTNYTYGNANTFTASVSNPAGGATLLWDDNFAPPRGAPFNSENIEFTLQNARGVDVPNRAFTLRAKNTVGSVYGTNYPSPASGSVFGTVDAQTDGSGFSSGSQFRTPEFAIGNAAFNGLNIKYSGGNLVEILVGGTVVGSVTMTITRPLGALGISGASRLDTGTTSPATNATTNPDRFRLTTANDIDTQSVLAESTFATLLSNVTWDAINNIPSATVVSGFPNPAGDLDDTATRSVSAASYNGGSTGVSVRINAGSSAGRFTVTASSGSVTSPAFTVDVFGVPQKVKLTTVSGGVSPTAGGFTGIPNGGSITVTPTFIDTFGHTIPNGELAFGPSLGTVTSGGGGTIIPVSAGSRDYIVTKGNTTTVATVTYNAITWTGAKGGSGSNSIARTFNVAP